MVKTGLDVLRSFNYGPLRGLRVGLVTHSAAISSDFRSALDLFRESDQFKLVTVFSPEHGYYGTAQDLISVADEDWGDLQIRSLYGKDFASLKPTRQDLAGLDCLVIDMVDIGSRYYTFQATMLYCLEAANEIGLHVMILDRPNPIGGELVEGPTIKPGFESFVGCYPLANRHGMTMGELAEMYYHERNYTNILEVIKCDGWQREMMFNDTGLPWSMPSPNIPTPVSALVYPGQCLLEGTNISEGRGTTRPFEICGAPWLNERKIAIALNHTELPGVYFRPLRFRPAFHKFANRDCGGVQIHVTDRQAFRPLLTTMLLLTVLMYESGNQFRWRTERYEFVDTIPAIDLLFGSDRERKKLDAMASIGDIWDEWQAEEEAFRVRRQKFLFYR